MEKLVVAAPKRLARELLADLQKAGVVHIDPLRPEELGEYRLSPSEEAEMRRWEGAVTQAEQALNVLGAKAVAAARPFTGSLEEAEAALKPVYSRAEQLGKEKAGLEEEIQTIDLFSKAADKLSGLAQGLDRSPRLTVIPFLLSKVEEVTAVQSALGAALQDRYAFDTDTLESSVAAVLVVKKEETEVARSALSRLGLAELRFPGVYGTLPLSQAAARMKERAASAPRDLAGTLQEVERLGRDSKDTLGTIWTRAKDESARYKTTADMAAGKYGAALMGWVPQKAKGKVEEALGRLRDQIVYAFEPVDEHHEGHQVPVTLDNPGWAKPYELLHGFLNTPRYGSYDPTIIIALFFPLFFGIVVGDMGLGLLFGLLAWWLGGKARRKENWEISFLGANLGPDVLSSLSRVLWAMTFWAVVWGFLYGEFFGTFLEKLKIWNGYTLFYPTGEFDNHPGFIEIIINRLDFALTANGLMLFSVMFGVAIVLYAFFVRMQEGLKHGHMSHFWEGLGYFSSSVALIVGAYMFLAGVNNPILLAIVIGGLALFVFAAIRSGIPLMFAEFLGKGGQILSFIRLYAVGVAGAVLASLANQVGFAMAREWGFIGGVLGFVIGLVLLLFIIAITTLGHLLQPIRLMWIEFGTNYGFYDESGRPYRPFKSVRSEQQG
ncbi:MAG: V-type ATPase 116kDa subunit family protein [Meiothermus sp.]|nr:V-type ATPase 116kDa subunit family protein [Meiothermus sp.]